MRIVRDPARTTGARRSANNLRRHLAIRPRVPQRSIAECVDRVLASAEVLPDSIDSVFLTGGSSFVPIVRRIFSKTFGVEKIRTGSEFTSIARGLALRAVEIAQT
jgi:molecular chaperone DnaK (HSP70)